MNVLRENIGIELAVWLVLGLLFGAYLMWAPRLIRATLLRVLFALAPLLALALVLIWSVLLPDGRITEAVLPALIAGTIVATGWLVTFLVAEYRRLSEDEARRTEKEVSRLDTLFALRSEIFALVDKLDNQSIAENARNVQQMIADGDGMDAEGNRVEYYPFSTRESEPIVFNAVSSLVPSLTPSTVDPVLRFYAEYTDMRSMVEDTRTELALSLPPQRRIALHAQLASRRKATLRWGLQALVQINRELGVENPENIQRTGKNADIQP